MDKAPGRAAADGSIKTNSMPRATEPSARGTHVAKGCKPMQFRARLHGACAPASLVLSLLLAGTAHASENAAAAPAAGS
jgi:hypothetical protein